LRHCRWHVLPPAPTEYLASIPGVSPLIAQLLYNRGLTQPSQIDSFLNADRRLSGDPWLLPDMHQAVARIYQALLSGENIAIYGDFDTDGITGTALFVQGLSTLGGKVIPYIPHRVNEGHGLRSAVLENLQQQGISLVVSVDCGVTGFTEVKRAQKKGLDIVITDHHTPSEEIPPAVAVVDPKLAHCNYPFSEMAGVGVAFKLLEALFQGVGKEKELEKLADLVALGTVADMVPLLSENRYLVKQGLNLINTNPRLGIREMITQAGLETGNIDTGSISWTLAPRLNAAGRLAHAMTSYNLLMTDSPAEARELTMRLEKTNTERQNLTAKVFNKAKEQIMAQGISPLLIASDREYPSGIAGLVAGRLSEEFYRPAIVIHTGELTSTGSCRSIPEFNIIAALNQCRHLFSRFGGHARAAGFTLPTKKLPELERSLQELATTQLSGLDLYPQMVIDAEITLPELSGSTFPAMQKLAPFGQENSMPIFLSHQVEVLDCHPIGGNGDHLKFRFKQQGATWEGVGFRLGKYLHEVASPLDIVYNLEVDHWNGEERLRLNILDFANTV